MEYLENITSLGFHAHKDKFLLFSRFSAHYPNDSIVSAPLHCPYLTKDVPELKDVAESVTVADVLQFLKSIKLDRYQELFEEEEMNGKLLQSLTKEDLQELGIDNAYHCRKIVSKFEEYLRCLKAEV